MIKEQVKLFKNLFSKRKMPPSKRIPDDSLITRNSRLTRFIHWIHLVSFLLLVFTGVAIYYPFLALPVGGLAVSMIFHRGLGIIYIVIHLFFIMRFFDRFIIHMSDYASWQAKDFIWLIKFPLYLSFPDKTKLPEHVGKLNPGQKLIGGAILTGSFLMAISGLLRMSFYLLPTSVSAGASVVHQVIFPLLILCFLGHTFIGSGILPIYRGVLRSIMGDGKLRAGLAKTHWKNWLDKGPQNSPVKGWKLLITLLIISTLIYGGLIFLSLPDIEPAIEPTFDEKKLSPGIYPDNEGKISLEVNKDGQMNYIIHKDSEKALSSWEAKDLLISTLIIEEDIKDDRR